MALPEWPMHPYETHPPEFNADSDHWRAAMHDYHRERAKAALARLRVAVEALTAVLPYIRHSDDCGFGSNSPNCLCGALPEYCAAKETLAAIGELPEEST